MSRRQRSCGNPIHDHAVRKYQHQVWSALGVGVLVTLGAVILAGFVIDRYRTTTADAARIASDAISNAPEAYASQVPEKCEDQVGEDQVRCLNEWAAKAKEQSDGHIETTRENLKDFKVKVETETELALGVVAILAVALGTLANNLFQTAREADSMRTRLEAIAELRWSVATGGKGATSEDLSKLFRQHARTVELVAANAEASRVCAFDAGGRSRSDFFDDEASRLWLEVIASEEEIRERLRDSEGSAEIQDDFLRLLTKG